MLVFRSPWPRVSSLFTVTMVNASPPGPAGGEYGDVRAGIDEVKLNAYLAANVPVVTVPVTIKQFKVCHQYFP